MALCTSNDFQCFLRLINNSDKNVLYNKQYKLLLYIYIKDNTTFLNIHESIFINILVSTLYQHFCTHEKLWYTPIHPNIICRDILTLSSYSLKEIKCPCNCRAMRRMFLRLHNYQLEDYEIYTSQPNNWQIDNMNDLIYINNLIVHWWKRDNINYLEILLRSFTLNETEQIITILDKCNCCKRHRCNRDKIY